MSVLSTGRSLSPFLWTLGSLKSIHGWRLTAVPTGPVQSRLQLGYPRFPLDNPLGELSDYPILLFYYVNYRFRIGLA